MSNLQKVLYLIIIIALFILPIADLKNIAKIGIVASTKDVLECWLFIAAIWVAYETYKLRILTTKQLNAANAPILAIYFREDPERIRVRNIGNGPAFNIRIEKIVVILEDLEREIEYQLEIADPPHLDTPRRTGFRRRNAFRRGTNPARRSRHRLAKP